MAKTNKETNKQTKNKRKKAVTWTSPIAGEEDLETN